MYFTLLFQVGCTWQDIKMLKDQIERNLTSTSIYLRGRLLQALDTLQVGNYGNLVMSCNMGDRQCWALNLSGKSTLLLGFKKQKSERITNPALSIA